MGVIFKISRGTTTITIATPAVLTYAAHGFAENDTIYLTTSGALPTGLAVGTPYYVISTGLTADTFRVSATKGGSAINTTGTQSGTHTLWVDRATKVSPETLNLQRVLTSQVDSVNFDITRKGGAASGGFKPALLDRVEIMDGSQVLFGGQITSMNSRVVDASDIETFSCTALDYSYDMNRHLVTHTFEGETIKDIIQWIADNILPTGYTTTNVVCSTVAASISFNYEYPTACLTQLASLVNYDWYVDGDKNIYFFEKSTVPAAFDLTDTSGNYYFNSLVLKDNLTSIRNSITVRGGEYIGQARTESQEADGEAAVYTQGYRYSDVTVTVNSVSKTVGIDNLNDPTLYDCLYNYQEKLIRFPDATKPTAGQIIEVGGSPHIPVLVRVIDADSINEFGEFEFKIVDKSISTRQEARERAQAELVGYAGEVNEGSFETMTAGLDVGQQINIQSTIRGTDTDYVISRIITTLVNGQQFKHSVTLMTTRTYGMIEFLLSLLTAQDKAIVISPNEVFGTIRAVEDNMALGDSLAAPSTSSPPYKWNTGTTPLVWGFGTWS